jgi:hypothetical protein
MPTKPTDTRTNAFPELDDFDGILKPKKVNPLSKVEPEPERHSRSKAGDPDLRRASAADTRAATSGINISAGGRDRLHQMPDLGPDEIDDEEAARRAGLRHGGGLEPREPGTDLVQPRDLANAAQNAVQVQGMQNPKWHAIRHLPAYLASQVRKMGRGTFGLITDTPIEDIITIANLGGQGPNTIEEVNAVAGWIIANGEFVRNVDFDFSQVMPDYEPLVREFRVGGIRFHLVQDDRGNPDDFDPNDPSKKGTYVYAYPEQDAKEPESLVVTDIGLPGPPGGMRRLPRFEGESLANEMRRTIQLLESSYSSPYDIFKMQQPQDNKKESKVASLSDEIRKNIQLLESLEEDIEGSKEIDQLMEELVALEAYRGKASKARYMDPEAQKKRMARHSTLAPLISKDPGGPRLISWLHKQLGLSAEADWGRDQAVRYNAATMPHMPKQSDKEISTRWGSGVWSDKVRDSRQLWSIIKSSPDNFIVFVGEKGVGAVRPKPGYIESMRKSKDNYEPAADRNLPYIYAFFTADQQWYNNSSDDAGVFDPDTGKIATRGGLFHGGDQNFNIVDAVTSMIGKLKRAYAAYPAPADYPHPEDLEYDDEGNPIPRSKDRPSVEREKIAQRAASRATPANTRSKHQLESDVFEKIKPVMSKLCKNAVGMVNRKAQRAVNGGNWDEAQRVARVGNTLNTIIAALDNPQEPGVPYQLSEKYRSALQYAASEHGVNIRDDQDYKDFLLSALTAGPETKSILDAVRSVLVGVQL